MIDIEDLFVLYRGPDHDVVALRGLSLSVASGERVVVNGPSGSGKSTLIKAVTAEVMPGAGRVVVLGRNLGQLGPAAARLLRRERIGIITQGSGRDLAPELTCLQNVALQARLSGTRPAIAEAAAAVALEQFHVDHLARRYPSTLSGGEAQRVGVASALACAPGVIVADEPTGELDRANAEVVYDLLAAHARSSGAGLLIVTHDVAANRIADRVITIRDGRVSNELFEGRSRLIVDRRGWVRLPDGDRDRAGITDRVNAHSEDHAITLVAPADQRSVDSAPPGWHDGWPEITAGQRDASVGDEMIRVREVSVMIGSTVVLSPLSFSVRRGALTVLAGPSGSGKTTMLGILGGLGVPTSGAIEFINGPPMSSIGSSLAGFAEQANSRDNLRLARRVRALEPADVDWALADLGIGHLADRPVSTLSGGERQRLGVARALVTGADLVLLDEPTSQLDESSAAQLAGVLHRLASHGRTIVCTSHDPAIIDLADAVVPLIAAAI